MDQPDADQAALTEPAVAAAQPATQTVSHNRASIVVAAIAILVIIIGFATYFYQRYSPKVATVPAVYKVTPTPTPTPSLAQASSSAVMTNSQLDQDLQNTSSNLDTMDKENGQAADGLNDQSTNLDY